MLKYYFSSDYRHSYHALEKLGLFSNTPHAHYPAYLAALTPNPRQPSILAHLSSLLSQRKASPQSTAKALLAVHAQLQTAKTTPNVSELLGLLNQLLGEVQKQLGERRKQSFKGQGMVRSAANIRELLSNEQVELEKEVFLLEKVCLPYLLYLQKLLSIFEFYQSLQRHFVRMMQGPEVWTLVNLIRMATKVTAKLSVMCRFIRRSYRPLAEAMGEALSADFNHYYPKIYKHIYNQAKITHYGTKVVEERLNLQQLLEEVEGVNTDLSDFYSSVAARHNPNIIEPRLINTLGREFEGIVEREGQGVEVCEMTPKFHQPSRHTCRTEEEDEEPRLAGILRDMSNREEAVTFRREKPWGESMLEEVQECQSMAENETVPLPQ